MGKKGSVIIRFLSLGPVAVDALRLLDRRFDVHVAASANAVDEADAREVGDLACREERCANTSPILVTRVGVQCC